MCDKLEVDDAWAADSDSGDSGEEEVDEDAGTDAGPSLTHQTKLLVRDFVLSVFLIKKNMHA